MSGQNRAHDDKKRKEKRTKKNAETRLTHQKKAAAGK
jgi:hypothetical protein